VAYRRIPASVSSVDASQGGKTDLPMSAVMEYCENPMALTPDEVVLEAIRG
jgi:hypothetical protein